jgi:hypothetical protein
MAQVIGFDYFSPSSAKNFNLIPYKVLPTGIYQGFGLAIVDDTNVTIQSGVLQINNSLNTTISPAQSVRIEETTNFIITVSSTNKYIIARLTWSDVVDDKCAYIATTYAGIQPNDIVLGKIIFAGSVATGIDYSYTNYSEVKLLKDRFNYFKVHLTAGATEDNSITIDPGKIVIGNAYIDSNGDTKTLPNVVASGMISVVVINNTGAITVINSSDTGSPTVPAIAAGDFPLAIITRPAQTGIKSENINSLNGKIHFYKV